MSNLIGQSLGRYHILEQLGEGGMAIVYKAFDTRLERDVAVKVISVDLFGQAFIGGILKRFEREAKALAKLSHPNIVGVIDYGEHEGAPYLVLEYLPGGTLKQRMGNTMPWQGAVRLLIPIANALQHAHEYKVIHRDVKPSNILLTEKGQPMLTDFGIAKILEMGDGHTLTGTGVGIGTPEYMAPEQGMGKDADGRADIYSLGVVFYELVTGRKPYTADTPMAVVLKQMTDPLPHPSQYVRDLPDTVEHVLIKALSKDPDDRYPDMDAFVMELEELQPDTARTKVNSPAKTMSKVQARSGDTRDTYEQADDETDESTVDAFDQTDETVAPPKKQKRVSTQTTFRSAKKQSSQVMPSLRWWPLLVLVGLLLLVWLASGGLVYFSSMKSASTDGTPYIFISEDGLPTGVEIIPAEGETVKVEHGSDGLWKLSLPFEAQADQGFVQAVADQITSLRMLEKVEAALDILGLNNPAYVINISFTDGKTHKLEVGSVTPTDSGYYTRIDGDMIVVLNKDGIDTLLNLQAFPPYVDMPTPTLLPTLTRMPTKPPTSTRLPSTSTPRPTSTSTPQPQSQAPMLTLRRNAYCRVGPGSEYTDVTAFLAGESFPILGWNPGGWWLVKVNVPGSKYDSCWVGSAVSDIQGNSSSVPVINP